MEQRGADPQHGSVEMWLDVAYGSLLEGGVEAVRILPLAKKLKLSRTSFYWVFEDRDALLNALLGRWKSKNTGNWITRTEVYADNVCEAVLNVFDCWFDDSVFDSPFESAIRGWALQSPEVAREVAEDDRLRIAALIALFERFDYGRATADVRARAMYLAQIGYASTQAREDISIRMMRVADYVEVFTGLKSGDRDLQRFFSRING
ncbi:TetR/AcrR family transcriptional regulator [Caballeronia sordidicola]|uniref:TetR/AcrR family transcriptional regulator n=1 Tax=Caballeronia sordidicola TaxID=196367 RepID=UPI000B7976CA|nr:TetR/AcrR family transcriptional regulator [Caballeronia sordidicola]